MSEEIVDAKETIKPGIKTKYGIFYPTGEEWILGFAFAGCQWAIDIVTRWEQEGKKIKWK